MRDDRMIYNRPMLIAEADLLWMASRLRGDTPGAPPAREAAASAARTVAGSVGVIPIIGPVSHRSSFFSEFFGGATVQGLRAALREALSDESITTIVLDVDSPGGEVDGTPELAAEIFAARGQKPIIAVVNTLAASAAYWLAAQADEVIISPSAQAGSIGVWVLHTDLSGMFEEAGIKHTFIFAGAHKVDANPFEPLSDVAAADLKAQVDEIMRDFLAAVSRGRGKSVRDLRAEDGGGDGRLFSARQAVRLGLADRMGTFDQVVERLAGGRRGRRRAEECSECMPHVHQAADGRRSRAPGYIGDPKFGRTCKQCQGTGQVMVLDEGWAVDALADLPGADEIGDADALIDELHEHSDGAAVLALRANGLETDEGEPAAASGATGDEQAQADRDLLDVTLAVMERPPS